MDGEWEGEATPAKLLSLPWDSGWGPSTLAAFVRCVIWNWLEWLLWGTCDDTLDSRLLKESEELKKRQQRAEKVTALINSVVALNETEK